MDRLTNLVDHGGTFDDVEVTVQQAKTHLSSILRRVEAGEEVTIKRGREPVAVLVAAPKDVRHIWGDLQGEMADDFDAPLEDFEPYR